MIHKWMFSMMVLALVLAACSAAGAEKQDRAAQLVDALQQAGARVQKVDSIEQPFFSVAGQVWRVNGHEIQLFAYANSAAADAEATLVAPGGGSIGPNMVTWMATPHFYRQDELLVLYVGDDAATLSLLEAVLGPQFAGGQGHASGGSHEIGEAALAGLARIGWDIAGFSAEVEVIDGDFARVLIHSSDPPGGFSAYLARAGGSWDVLAHGSAFNPQELLDKGIPGSLIP